ncbi:MAG: sensor histidine kinase [Desulfatitalea sp.]
MKLAAKLSLLFLLLSTLPIVIVGYLAYQNGRTTIERETINYLQSINMHKRAELNRWIGSNALLLEMVANSYFFKYGFADVMSAHDPAAPDHLAMHRKIIERHLKPFIEGSDFFELFILRAGDGKVLLSTDETQEEKFHETSPYFIHGQKGPHIQNVYYSMALRQPAMVIGTPLRDPQGRLIAVLAGRVDLSALSKIFETRGRLKFSEDSYLVNTFNFFITEPRFGKNYALRKSVHTEGVRAVLEGREGVGFYDDYRGVAVIGAYQWLAEWELGLITEIDQKEAFAPIYALRKKVAAAGAGITLLAALAGWSLARTITRPVQRLVQGAEQIGQGNLAYTVATAGKDEIGHLSRSFDRMKDKLKTTLVSRDQLTREVAARELTEASLREREQELERKNAELERFTYTISHDLKSPLVTVKTFAGYLVQDLIQGDSERIEKDLHFIRGAADKMDRLLDELLEMSRIGRMVNAPVAVAFRALVDEALNAVAGSISTTGTTVQVADLALTLHGDRPRLVEIWQNLVENAVKYMGDQPAPCIEIGATPNGPETVFFVRDNGMGIDPRYHAKIFGWFQKLDPKSSGTGLGLALAKRIVELYKGAIRLESQGAGQGTCFYFTLPEAFTTPPLTIDKGVVPGVNIPG